MDITPANIGITKKNGKLILKLFDVESILNVSNVHRARLTLIPPEYEDREEWKKLKPE